MILCDRIWTAPEECESGVGRGSGIEWLGLAPGISCWDPNATLELGESSSESHYWTWMKRPDLMRIRIDLEISSDPSFLIEHRYTVITIGNRREGDGNFVQLQSS